MGLLEERFAHLLMMTEPRRSKGGALRRWLFLDLCELNDAPTLMKRSKKRSSTKPRGRPMAKSFSTTIDGVVIDLGVPPYVIAAMVNIMTMRKEARGSIKRKSDINRTRVRGEVWEAAEDAAACLLDDEQVQLSDQQWTVLQQRVYECWRRHRKAGDLKSLPSPRGVKS